MDSPEKEKIPNAMAPISPVEFIQLAGEVGINPEELRRRVGASLPTAVYVAEGNRREVRMNIPGEGVGILQTILADAGLSNGPSGCIFAPGFRENPSVLFRLDARVRLSVQHLCEGKVTIRHACNYSAADMARVGLFFPDAVAREGEQLHSMSMDVDGETVMDISSAIVSKKPEYMSFVRLLEDVLLNKVPMPARMENT